MPHRLLLCFLRSGIFLLLLFQQTEGKIQIKQLILIGEIRIQNLSDSLQTVQQRTSVNIKFPRRLCCVQIFLQINPKCPVIFRMLLRIDLLQSRKLLSRLVLCSKI